MDTDTVWLAVGFVGQGLFGARFLVQWLYSERRRQSVVPAAFWYLSVAGGAVLLCYAVYRLDPVFMLGQGIGVLIYLRNLALIRRGRSAGAADRDAP
jgi:lipid-A-disaccharide synthase-like uncharacterized protein